MLRTLLVFASLAAACRLDLAQARCPCISGWICCETSDRCVPAGEVPASCNTRPVGGSSERGRPDGEDGNIGRLGAWVTISQRTFSMGSPSDEGCRDNNEDQHDVELTRAFEMSKTEVTQTQFIELMGYNPSHFAACGPTCPVEQVSWFEAVAYCNELSEREDLPVCYDCTGSRDQVSCKTASDYANDIYACKGYRLPTDSEWEAAYRGPLQTPYHSGTEVVLPCDQCTHDAALSAIAWYCGNSGHETHPAATKSANAEGLFDMSGNVFEWCHDWYARRLGTAKQSDPMGPPSGSERVVRGGSFADLGRYLSAANRFLLPPTERRTWVGFRCARTIHPQ